MYKIAIVIFALLLSSACSTVRVAGECSESVNLKCMTKKICSEDTKRGCQVCSCEAAWISDPDQQDKMMRGREP
jgi:hypothetical protein